MNKHVKNKLYDSTKGFNLSLVLLFIRPSSDPLEGRKNDSKNSFAMIFSDNYFLVRGKATAKMKRAPRFLVTTPNTKAQRGS
jgi:hypothetical protein